MAVFSIRCLALTSLLMVGVLVCSHRVLAQDCDGDLASLVLECAQYVVKEGPKTPPSQQCCDVVKKIDFPCVCKHVTKDLENVISLEKAVYVADYCGRPLAHGTKCGSYTVPLP